MDCVIVCDEQEDVLLVETYEYCTARSNTDNYGMWKTSDILPCMSVSVIKRTAMLQMRVPPEIKYASEHVFRRIGLNMTDAMELFLRRVIVDQRIPFEVVALDQATLTSLVENWEIEHRGMRKIEIGNTLKGKAKKVRSKRE